MKIIVFTALALAVILTSCHKNKQEPVIRKYYPKEEVKDPSFLDLPIEEQNRILDSLTAEGEAIIVRGSDREYDTIIGHIRYRHIKDE